MTEIKVEQYPLATRSPQVNENTWHAWIAKGRGREARLNQRVVVGLAFSPFLFAFAWFWFHM
jgi:hypothetical protein